MSRHVAVNEASKQQVQVQVLLRTTGDFFCLTQFQNQYPELDPGLRPSPVAFPEPRGGSRAACAAAGAARPFPAPVGLSMAMHVHAYARIRPRLDSGWPGQQFERGGFDMPPPQWGWGGAAPPRSRARMAFEVYYPHKPAAVLVYN